ncbi:unnamed protein product [Protopolystoma xenopodis]|uniref:Uncharacterized protein n=1 Tax=Protopolystoma xenopodis TaxID=117903 RepID=A0A3S5AAU1_9PLAT|nr:unnamed protein product [Protopolystoma xenopodis]
MEGQLKLQCHRTTETTLDDSARLLSNVRTTGLDFRRPVKAVHKHRPHNRLYAKMPSQHSCQADGGKNDPRPRASPAPGRLARDASSGPRPAAWRRIIRPTDGHPPTAGLAPRDGTREASATCCWAEQMVCEAPASVGAGPNPRRVQEAGVIGGPSAGAPQRRRLPELLREAAVASNS